MACNPKKCNELILCKKVAHDIDPVNNIVQVSCLKKLGFTLQSNHRFTEHIKVKLQEANKCLYGIRCLGKEEHLQRDVDYVFRSTNVRSSCIRLLNTSINNGPEFSTALL